MLDTRGDGMIDAGFGLSGSSLATHGIAADGRMKHYLADKLRRLADRIDDHGAPKALGLSFTFEDRVGLVIHDDDRGCRIWYLNDDEYERAHHPAQPP